MPRTVPSQVVSYLTQIFNRRAPLAAAVVLQKIGAVAGFLELYDQLPAELIRLSADDYAILISEIGTIRFRIDQYRRGAAWGHLEPVGPALDKVWEIIEKLQDEVPSTAHDLSFIADPELREMIGLDVAAISTDRQSGEWKGATILAGSCCEALLLFALQTRDKNASGTVAAAVSATSWPGKAPEPSDLTDRSWTLFAYAEVARNLDLILPNTKNATDSARGYRNLIHPAKVVRETTRFHRGTAFVAAGAVESIIDDLRKNLAS
jgi:hypothetical protein